MLEAIRVGWKLEATRSFIQLYFAVIVMFSYAFFMVQHTGSYFKLVVCAALLAISLFTFVLLLFIMTLKKFFMVLKP